MWILILKRQDFRKRVVHLDLGSAEAILLAVPAALTLLAVMAAGAVANEAHEGAEKATAPHHRCGSRHTVSAALPVDWQRRLSEMRLHLLPAGHLLFVRSLREICGEAGRLGSALGLLSTAAPQAKGLPPGS